MLEHIYKHTDRVGVVMVDTIITYSLINFEIRIKSIEIKANGGSKVVDQESHRFFVRPHCRAMTKRAADDIERLKQAEIDNHKPQQMRA